VLREDGGLEVRATTVLEFGLGTVFPTVFGLTIAIFILCCEWHLCFDEEFSGVFSETLLADRLPEAEVVLATFLGLSTENSATEDVCFLEYPILLDFSGTIRFITTL